MPRGVPKSSAMEPLDTIAQRYMKLRTCLFCGHGPETCVCQRAAQSRPLSASSQDDPKFVAPKQRAASVSTETAYSREALIAVLLDAWNKAKGKK